MLSTCTQNIIAQKYKHFKPTHIEFAILNAAGLTLKEIAALMCVSYGATKDYCDTLCKQFNVAERHELAKRRMKYGIVKLAYYFDASIAA